MFWLLHKCGPTRCHCALAYYSASGGVSRRSDPLRPWRRFNVWAKWIKCTVPAAKPKTIPREVKMGKMCNHRSAKKPRRPGKTSSSAIVMTCELISYPFTQTARVSRLERSCFRGNIVPPISWVCLLPQSVQTNSQDIRWHSTPDWSYKPLSTVR